MSLESRPKKGQEHRKKPQYDWRYRVYYTALDGTRKQKNSKWFPDRETAETEETKFKASLLYSADSSIKFKLVAYDWLSYNKDKNVLRVYKEKEYFIQHFYLPVFGGFNINEIKPLHIKRWLESDLMHSRSKSYKNGRTKTIVFSAAYKNKILTYLNSIFEHACTFFELKSNPCKRVKKFKSENKKKTNMVIYSINEFNRFIEAIPETKAIYKAYFHTLFYTGLRKNECRSLRFEDFHDNYLDVYHQLESGYDNFAKLKTESSIRKIQLDTKTLEIINTLKDQYSKLAGFTDKWFIFGGTKPLSRKTLENVKNAAVKDADLPYLTIHDFRHSHASYLINNGANIVAVSKRLGHSSITMTLDTYTHLMPDTQDQLIEIINKKM